MVMRGRVLPFDTSEHAAADQLLPFYVNETLRGEELSFVRQHLQSCEKCQREVEWLRTVYDACAVDPALQAAVAQTLERSPQARANPGSEHESGTRMSKGWRAAPVWTRWLMAAQLAAVAVLATLLLADTRSVPEYRTLGTSQPTSQARSNAVAVMFDPAIKESDLRHMLQDVGARIVDGPSSTDVYLVDIPAERTPQALQTLRAQPGVRLAESLGPRTAQ